MLKNQVSFFINKQKQILTLHSQTACLTQPVEDGLVILSRRREGNFRQMVMPNPGVFRLHQLHRPHCPLPKLFPY